MSDGALHLVLLLFFTCSGGANGSQRAQHRERRTTYTVVGEEASLEMTSKLGTKLSLGHQRLKNIVLI
ncbi:hypothetical protein CsatA_000324 [Cannabis sativa]